MICLNFFLRSVEKNQKGSCYLLNSWWDRVMFFSVSFSDLSFDNHKKGLGMGYVLIKILQDHKYVPIIAICSPNSVQVAKGRDLKKNFRVRNVEPKARFFYVQP